MTDSSAVADEFGARPSDDGYDDYPRGAFLTDDLYGTSDDRLPELHIASAPRALMLTLADLIRRHKLLIACLVYVLMDIFTTVYYKRLMDHTGNYAIVTMEVLVIFFLGLFWSLYWACSYLFPAYMAHPFNYRQLIPMSLFDIVSTLLSTMGSVETSGIVLVMLSQVSIPLTIITCKLILGRVYHWYQYLGSLLIVLFVIIKELTVPMTTGSNNLVANMLYMASCLPDSIASALRSGVYMSESFHLLKYQVSAISLQFVLGFPLFAFTLAARRTQPDLGVLSGSLHDVGSGLACLFLGRNTIVDQCSSSGDITCDNCEGAFRVLLTYLLCNLIIRVAYVVIMMNATVTLVFLLGTLKLPLCSIAFSMKSLSGDSATAFEIIDVVCFVGIMASLGMYAMGRKMLDAPPECPYAQPMLPDTE
ncbi:Putative chloroquine resistance transporter [Babesia bigemina]|uniref:Putative chloroquine resistance transporter n=1 Tax=Babesia bigemina TaxID=5866 RepID=A0A061DB79_BABBI|nr:Putative chloroquine resistance transporter [Babesia bigemina]CDR97232.1 Putative chloroquine resistance transporter [Babesia bigemina]|eukprot:XP_012769418.1 Putative chloroquine resistance transporter [Babesia bigemina]